MCQSLPKRKKKVALKYQIFQTSFQYVGGFPIKFLLNLHNFHTKKNFIKVRNCTFVQAHTDSTTYCVFHLAEEQMKCTVDFG